LLNQISKNGDDNIVSANISNVLTNNEDEIYIAYSDVKKFVLLEFNFNENELKKVKIPSEVKNFPCKFIHFSEMKKTSTDIIAYLISNNGSLLIYNITKSSINNIVLKTNSPQIVLDSCISPNNKNILISTLNKEIFVFDIDNLKVDSNYPKCNRYITNVKFVDDNAFILLDEDNK